MKMYHWDTVEALRNYGYGDVIVVAESPQEAREKAMEHVPGYMICRSPGWLDTYKEHALNWRAIIDEWRIDDNMIDYVREFDDKVTQLRQDLATEPAEMPCGVVALYGSE